MMKNTLLKLISAVLCLCVILCFAACSSDDKKTADPNSNNVNFNGLDMEFKYSRDCSNWTEVAADTELFRADGKYAAGDIEIVYLHFKNHADSAVNFKLTLKNIRGSAGGAMFGIVDNVRLAYSDQNNAVADAEKNAKPVDSGYISSGLMEADSVKTVAVVVYVPQGAAAADMKLRVDFSAIAYTAGDSNSSTTDNGLISVNANGYAIVSDPAKETVITNDDNSFKAVFAANSVAQGAFLMASVKPSAVSQGSAAYDIKLSCDGAAYASAPVELSILTGYGLTGVEVYHGETKLDSTYDMYSGLAVFSAVASGQYTVKYSGTTDITGVLVQGAEKPFDNFNAAIDYVVNKDAYELGEIVTFIIFGRAEYTVLSGEKVSFTGKHENILTVNVVGGNDKAEIFITRDSGSVPSLPYAGEGVQINYSNLIFQSENEMMVDNQYSHHFDYRGDADISFRNCTFLKALATRGPKSSVVVDNCVFKCKTQADTLKGYCYYSIQAIGMNEIDVTFTNNTVTENWGGINLDWSMADFYVANNSFANITCSKPPIQLSNATTMVIENNTFTNIKDENAFRFYKSYSADSTKIVNNTIDADYLFQSDTPGAINSLKDFTFEGNTISSTTNLHLGHEANAPADQISPHNYTVDTAANTIK